MQSACAYTMDFVAAHKQINKLNYVSSVLKLYANGTFFRVVNKPNLIYLNKLQNKILY